LFNDKENFINTLTHSDTISENEFFNNNQDEEFKKNIESFHNWYCALAECLRGEKTR